MKKMKFVMCFLSFSFVSSSCLAMPVDVEDVLGLNQPEESTEETETKVPVADLGFDLDENFPAPPPTPAPAPAKPSSVTDSSINARLATLEQNQGVIITKLNAIAQSVAKPQLTKEDVDVVVRKAINDLVVPHLTIRTKDGINKTVASNSNGGFKLNPGERLVAIDGIPVSQPVVVNAPKFTSPVYEVVSGNWKARYTSGDGLLFGGIRSNCPGGVCPTR